MISCLTVRRPKIVRKILEDGPSERIKKEVNSGDEVEINSDDEEEEGEEEGGRSFFFQEHTG